MHLERVQFVEAVQVGGHSTSSLTRAGGWELEVGELGLIARGEAGACIWVPLANIKGGVPCPEKKVEESAPLYFEAGAARECPDCEFKTSYPAAYASHRRAKHPEAA
jgi:hypothetical protein